MVFRNGFIGFVLIIFFCTGKYSFSCTNFIVTKGASVNNSVMITYAADSHTRYGSLYYSPAADYPEGSMLDIYHYESGKWLGQIPQVKHTYSVIGFMNEFQVAIGETTFGGLDSLASQPGAILDYGSLMKIALQRSKTAREAMKTIAELMDKYGYATGGESFSISDKNEAWIMEIIGKGKYEKGAVWVALQIPDGYVSGHANQARIRTFPAQKGNNWTNLSQTCFHSPDVIQFAKKHNFYKGKDADFSFSDVYNPLKFNGARFCDARIWSFFRKLNIEIANTSDYTNYAMGKFKYDPICVDQTANPNKYVSNRLPLWIKPDQKISIEFVMEMMRDHYEGTPLDMCNDFGAGPYKCPYRWRPMEYISDSTTYIHERAIATQQTGFSFVAQSRASFPDPIGGIFWFGVDDADASVYTPIYCGSTKIPQSYATGNGSMIEWSDSSAFWTFNLLTNWSYSRYNQIHPEIEEYQKELETSFLLAVSKIDSSAVLLYSHQPQKAIDLITNFSVNNADNLVVKWKVFFQYLFMKYLDGNVKKSENHKLLDNGNGKGVPARPSHPGYGKEWEKKMGKIRN